MAVQLHLNLHCHQEYQCAKQCPKFIDTVSTTQFFTMFLIIFPKPRALVEEKEHVIPSLDKASLPFHTRLVLPHIHLELDPNPRTM